MRVFVDRTFVCVTPATEESLWETQSCPCTSEFGRLRDFNEQNEHCMVQVGPQLDKEQQLMHFGFRHGEVVRWCFGRAKINTSGSVDSFKT